MGIHYIQQADQRPSHCDCYEREIILTVFKDIRKEFFKDAKPQDWFDESKYKEFCTLVGKSFSLIMWANTYEYPMNPMKDEDEEYDIDVETYATPMKELVNIMKEEGIADPMEALKSAQYKSHSFNLYYGEYLRYSYVVVPLN